ncbi:MAG: isoleucine--tRNA ligase [Acidimicrobiia bacterium]|nr:isoleucine--tRNA ligase [Acidimicrobiia bacterium]
MPNHRNARSGFTRVDPKVDFAAQEEAILRLWDDQGTFEASIEARPETQSYTFYDGPPFPTGSPHYGNLLAGIIKDIVPRYWTMRGYRVERRFGWDTHGLPIEMEVEKQLGISGPRQIFDYGIDKYNEACRAVVQTNTETWERITRRIGRWVDFENDYKTMDLDFMESVWWVFKELWDKGLVYQDFKVLPYSWGATTPLSNFEANLEYRDVDDPSITVRLEVLESKGGVQSGDWLLIWTTTPWTLPSNLALAVRDDIEYACAVDDEGRRQWVARDLLERVLGEEATPVATTMGSDLVGIQYRPPFDYFGDERDRGAFRVIHTDEVTTDEGTGMVHMAPAFGEADFYALQAAGLDVLVDPVDLEGRFMEPVSDVVGMNVKEADGPLIRLLADRGLLVHRSTIRHSYPFCWRTGTPLIYKAIPTWFVRVESFRDRMVELNETIHWVPDHIGSRRFGNWLEGARDWAISRNRYWGSCIPVWECDTGPHQVCVGSVDDLEALSGIRLDDLHKHFVDPVTFSCAECEGTMRRVPEVLDCWFESGSMPYAQGHYPFENQAAFEAGFPANFIAEGIDQTRGWFYTLVVLATALFDNVPFRNCIVNGHILAEDGRKMSKSLKNYPDPEELLSKFGGDALRAYLIDSPVLRAEPLRFSEAGVREVVRSVMIPLWNAYSFFTTYAEADGITVEDLTDAPEPGDRPELDRWILSVLQSLVADVNEQMEGYYLYAVIRPTLSFIDDLTNWYIRRSRRRFWRSRAEGDTDKLSAFATLYEVLVTFTKVLAPVLPFITETIHQGLAVGHTADAERSVHLTRYPVATADLIDGPLEESMATVRLVVSLGHALRKQNGIKVRQPLHAVTILTRDTDVITAVAQHVDLIAEELNVRLVTTSVDETGLVELSARCNFAVLGPKLGPGVKPVAAGIADLSSQDVERILEGQTLDVAGQVVGLEDIVVDRTPRQGLVVASDSLLSVALETDLDDDLRQEGLAREIIAIVQRLRREAGLEVSDRINLTWSASTGRAEQVFESMGMLIAGETLAQSIVRSDGIAADMHVDGVPLGLRVDRV